ncbi:MAG: ABC transporter permease subunit [Akkermansia sp.]
MTKNLTGLLLILAALLGVLGELHGWLLPTISWPFTLSREFECLQYPGWYTPWLEVDGRCHWFGWLCMALLALLGCIILLRSRDSLRLPPEYRKRLQRFASIRRGKWSLILLGLLLVLAGLDQSIVGKRALAVEYKGRWYFPAFTRAVLPGSTFDLMGDDERAETDYRALAQEQGCPGRPSLVLMPPVPYEPVADVAPFPTEPLEWRGGLLCRHNGQPYNGLACRLYPDGQVHLRLRYRNGRLDGQATGWARDRREVYSAHYAAGELRSSSYADGADPTDFLAQSDPHRLYIVYYHPAPPLTGGHLLGTNSQGADILAYLYGGLQVNIKAALLYLPVIYAIGLTVGMLMGYFGGRFDLVVQRGIEILSQLPFLFVVMILSDLVPQELRGFVLILGLLCLFGWMPMTYLIRTATMKEKTRDYVAAARVMGAGPMHILFRHILPNLTGIIVTLVPFSVAAVVLSLTSLDYLGFGLPDTYAGWGRLLNDGLSKLSSPWIVSSAFGALVATLLMVTFIGEAFREASDPRRRTYYES